MNSNYHSGYKDKPAHHVETSNQPSNIDVGALDYVNTQDLINQRDEALRKEEALRDRLKLQEAISAKQLNELRIQTRKLTTENQRFYKSSIISGTGGKGDRKRDVKVKDTKKLLKTIDQLQNENSTLKKKLEEMANFIQVASDIKLHSVSECKKKDELIFRLRAEKEATRHVIEEEVERRSKVENELYSFQNYLVYSSAKSREQLRHKAVQTMTSIPVRTAGSVRTGIVRSRLVRRTSSDIFHKPPIIKRREITCLSYTAEVNKSALHRLKVVENKHKVQSDGMRKKFHDVIGRA
nr:uncharacterized protein LOC100180312 [Ciona intestinalis]|eukprot:XP_002120632.1 uncharacterized protein LOC100180312 [Ciona intestinalis]